MNYKIIAYILAAVGFTFCVIGFAVTFYILFRLHWAIGAFLTGVILVAISAYMLNNVFENKDYDENKDFDED